jgi:beta-glucosidase-like glycosyl hydrolase
VDLDRKIGQLFVVPAPRPDLIHHVRHNHVGGVIWFQTTAVEAARVNQELQSLAEVPLLVSADLEAGMGMRFTDREWWLPAMALAATGDPAHAEEQARVTAREALAAGINHVLAPVADVNVDPRNPVINTRSFGEDPHDVARYVAAFVRGLEEEGVLATAKHFPGHGDTRTDSHRSLPVLDVTRERLEQVELVPFRAAIAVGVSSVMIGHLGVPTLDPTPAPVREHFENVYGTAAAEVPRHATMPATLSMPIVDLLRRDLGFEGLVLTDAMDMGGLAAHFDAGEAAVRAVEAGVDQILFSVDTDAAIAAVKEAVRTGRLTERRIDESVERILAAKKKVERRASARRTFDGGLKAAAPQDDIADRAIQIARDTHNLLPLRAEKLAVTVVAPHGDPIAIGIEQTATPDDAEVLLLLLAIRPRSGAGTISVPEEVQRLAQRYAHKTVVVSFGSPYVIRELGDVSTFVCAWGPQPVLQRAALRALQRGEPD